MRFGRAAGWVALLVALLAVFAQNRWADGWTAQIGPSLREMSVLVFVFGLFEKIWEGDGRRPGLRYVLIITSVGLTLFAFGNIMDAHARKASHGADDKTSR